MSIGKEPTGSGWLHVPPVQCTSCTKGSVVQDGSPDDPESVTSGFDIVTDVDSQTANATIQVGSGTTGI